MLLSYFMVAIAALTSGIIIGRSDVRQAHRRRVQTIKHHRLYLAWSNPAKTARKN